MLNKFEISLPTLKSELKYVINFKAKKKKKDKMIWYK